MELTQKLYPLFISGGIAGAVIDLTLHPLDYIKTRQHRNQKLDKKASSFYKGLSAALISSFLCAATFWTFYMVCKETMLSRNYSLPSVETTASIIASFACCIMRNPFERVKQLVQIGDNINLIGATLKIYKSDGVEGFYNGFSALCVRELPFDTIQMLMFQSLSHLLLIDFGGFNPFIYGGIAGGFTAYITTPIDVVKTLMMTNTSQCKNFIRTLLTLYEKEGIGALWKGWIVRVIYITFGGTLYFGVFNMTFKMLAN